MRIDPGELLDLFNDAPESLSIREIIRELRLSPGDKIPLRRLLKSMEEDGHIERITGTTWRRARVKRGKDPLRGKLSINRRGMGFVRLDEASKAQARDDSDIYIGELDLADALDGDTVEVGRVSPSPRGPVGKIIRVVERATHTVVGYYQKVSDKEGEVIPRSAFLHRRVIVDPPAKELGIRDHEWVVAKITDFTNAPRALRGEVVERLGAAHDKGIDVLLVLRDRGIIEEFPVEVQRAADTLEVDWESELPLRHDLRGLPTATIDPATAKDFDDAMSIEPLEGGGWRLWVHIADVSHFVRPDEPIDIEARERSTSVYPVDRVVPMLPEKLSNDLCSLRPREDRLAMTAEMEVSAKGEIGASRFYSSVINSNQRLTYEQAQAFLMQEEGSADVVAPELHEPLIMLRDCARVMRRARFARGALDLDIPEMVVEFSPVGSVSGLGLRERFEAHMTVEDCMLAANEAVARFLTKRQIPMLYRIHEPADPDRLEMLVPVLKAMGVTLRTGKKGEITPHDLQHALRQLENRPAGHVLRRLVLRALKQAKYSEKNAGHFGLASKCYCHFTSPIRRYPDVVVHRQLRAIERGEPLPYPKTDEAIAEVHELGNHTSFKEREAADAERETQNMKAVEFLEQFVGDEFEGYITSVQNFGLFVELRPHGVEGLVSVRSLSDHFELDDLGIELVGKRTGKRLRLTDEVKVRLVKADAFAGHLDLQLLDSTTNTAYSRKPNQASRGNDSKPNKSRKPEMPFYKKVSKKGKKGGKKR